MGWLILDELVDIITALGVLGYCCVLGIVIALTIVYISKKTQ
jgi:hypothetical protein